MAAVFVSENVREGELEQSFFLPARRQRCWYAGRTFFSQTTNYFYSENDKNLLLLTIFIGIKEELLRGV